MPAEPATTTMNWDLHIINPNNLRKPSKILTALPEQRTVSGILLCIKLAMPIYNLTNSYQRAAHLSVQQRWISFHKFKKTPCFSLLCCLSKWTSTPTTNLFGLLKTTWANILTLKENEMSINTWWMYIRILPILPRHSSQLKNCPQKTRSSKKSIRPLRLITAWNFFKKASSPMHTPPSSV